MSRLWKWLARANAKGVFFGLLAALVVVIGWWAWREAFPAKVGTPVPSSVPREDKAADLGVLSLLQEQVSAQAVQPLEDPFYHAPKNPYREKPAEGPGEGRPSVAPKPVPAAVVAKAPPPPPRPKKTVTLIYRGLIMRSDGRTIAMVEDAVTKRSVALTNGASLRGVQVADIASDSIRLRLNGGQAKDLRVGISTVLTEDDGVQ